jgi:hypothetical protein
MVGAPGFEPGASCAQGRRATRLRYAPTFLRSYSTAFYVIVFNGDRLPAPKLCRKTIGCRMKPTDAMIRLSATCVCGSDFWPHRGIQSTA